MEKALIISLLFNVVIISAFAIRRYYYRLKPANAMVSQWSITWDAQKRDLYNAVKIDNGDIVFVGDSHIERFLLNDYFPGKPIKNRGIGSNTTMQVISRLPAILQRKPSKLFLQVGINDLAFGYSPDNTINNIVSIINMVDRSMTDLYVVSLFPTRGNDSHLNNNVKSINVSLECYCINNNIPFINIYPQLVDNGELNKELAADDCHLNSNGYKVWHQAIEKYI